MSGINKTISDLEKSMEKVLDAKRYRHTLGVAYTAASLAMSYGCDVHSAYLAGLLHDNAKHMTTRQQIEVCQEHGMDPDLLKTKNPEILHADAGAFLAEDLYGIHDSNVLNAIRFHTTGRPGMNILEEIIYVADYIEPNRRELEGIQQIRQVAFHNLEQAMVLISKNTIHYLEGKGQNIDPATRETYDYYIRSNQMNEKAKKMVQEAILALEDKKAEDIKIINISEVSVLADYFIIASGTNKSQIQAMVDSVEERLGRLGYEKKHAEGYESANWILLDFSDIIVHVFDKENRSYYNLERIWRDGKTVEIEELK